MNPPDFIIVVLLIIFGSVLLGKVLGLVRFWIEKRHESRNDELLKTPEFLQALREFKQKTDCRLTDIEAAITDMKRSDGEGIIDPSDQEKIILPEDQETRILWPENTDTDDEETDRMSDATGDQPLDTEQESSKYAKQASGMEL